MLFLIDGGYHVLFAVHELCAAKGIDPFDNAKPAKMIPDAITLVKQLVNAEMMSDKSFTTNRYFKDAKTKAQVQRAVASTPESRRAMKTGARTKASTVPRKARKRTSLSR